MKCAFCRFWHLSPNLSRGIAAHFSEQCRRHAPVLVAGTEAGKTTPFANAWPLTRGDDYCGDFEWVPEFEPCRQCRGPSGTDAKRYGTGPVCKACDDAMPRFEGPIPK